MLIPRYLPWLPLFLLVLCATAWAEDETPYDRSSFIRDALAGDLSSAEAGLAANPDPKAAELLGKFRARFVTGEEALPSPDDPALAKVLSLYRPYWVAALLSPDHREDLEADLRDELIQIISPDEQLAPEDVIDRLPAFIAERGYRSIAGRTPPLLDIILWERDEVTPTEVELTDGVVTVPLISMENFSSYGWTYFATFGAAQSGGWADKEGIHLVKAAYDLDSEAYRISFLKHESRHYADYTLFPALQGADLEYRAKLTELVYAEESQLRLLRHFTGHAKKVANAPHSLASWYLVTALADRLLETEDFPRPDDWEKVAPGEVRQAARDLLDEHTAALKAAGAETVTGILTP